MEKNIIVEDMGMICVDCIISLGGILEVILNFEQLRKRFNFRSRIDYKLYLFVVFLSVCQFLEIKFIIVKDVWNGVFC